MADSNQIEISHGGETTNRTAEKSVPEKEDETAKKAPQITDGTGASCAQIPNSTSQNQKTEKKKEKPKEQQKTEKTKKVDKNGGKKKETPQTKLVTTNQPPANSTAIKVPRGTPVPLTDAELTDKLLQFKKTMHDQKEAKKEEDEYLKLRKQQLLMDFLPKTKAAKLRRTDDKFPSSIFKQMERYNFGAMKAKYLAMRPNGKFATWFGKNHDKEHRNETIISLRDRIRAAKQASNAAIQIKSCDFEPKKLKKEHHHHPKEVTQKRKVKEVQQLCQKALPCIPEPAKKEEGAEKAQTAPIEEDDRRNNSRNRRALSPRGLPFWTDEPTNDAETEEEAEVVNKDVIMTHGSESMQKPRVNRSHIPFDSAGSLAVMRDLDVNFAGSILWHATIQNVIAVWVEGQEKPILPPLVPAKLTFANTLNRLDYDPGAENIAHKKGFKIVTENVKFSEKPNEGW